jgi:hypothetical protein
LLPIEVAGRPEVSRRLTNYLAGRDDQSLIWQIHSIFENTRAERDDLSARRTELDAEAKRVRRREHETEEGSKASLRIKRDKGTDQPRAPPEHRRRLGFGGP